MSSLMDMLLARPDAAQKMMGLLPLLQSMGGEPPRDTYSPGSYTTGNTPSETGNLNMPNGDTQYPYRDYPKPYTSGVPANLVTRQGVTLQRGPMRSLIDIARQSQILPGIQEIGQIGQGYRTHGQQQSAAATNPYAADPGQSYHEQGLAIDAGWWSAREKLNRLLYEAGWNQFDRGYEPWHYSYGVTG